MENPIRADDPRYEPSRNQRFNNFEEGWQLIHDYCKKAEILYLLILVPTIKGIDVICFTI